MANATSAVQMSMAPHTATGIKRPLAATAAIYYRGSMICLDASGNAVKAYDTAGLKFDGIAINTDRIEVLSGDSAGDHVIDVARPFRFTMNIGSASAGDEGRMVFASDDQTVAYSTTNSIAVGFVDKVVSSTVVLIRPIYEGARGNSTFDGATLTFNSTNGTNNIAMPDNLVLALQVMQGSNRYLSFNTADSGGERIEAAKEVRLLDNVNLTLGTDGDVYTRFDNTDLDILSITDDEVIKWGNGTNSFDQWWYGNNAADYLLWDASLNALACVGNASIRPKAITDPGNAGAISNVASGYVPLVTAAAETRTLDIPSFIGQELLVYMKTDMGDCVLTVTGAVNEAGNNTITFNDTGDSLHIRAVEQGAGLVWRLGAVDGAGISTV